MAAHAQNEIAARMEMEDAEKAYSENRFYKALEALQQAESLLGKWTGRVSHLKILALDRLCNYSDPESAYFTQLEAEIVKYLDYANKNAAEVVMDKVREVYEINKKIETAVKEAPLMAALKTEMDAEWELVKNTAGPDDIKKWLSMYPDKNTVAYKDAATRLDTLVKREIRQKNIAIAGETVFVEGGTFDPGKYHITLNS
jgi:hypothetical protein